MAGNIIPAIATTNAMVAGLCALQAVKVFKEDGFAKARTVFLATSTDRVISAEDLKPPKPDCPVCSAAQSKLLVDLANAKLEDLVGGVLKAELGYGDELSVSSDVGILYDPELDDNLTKKLSDLGITAGSFITVVDDEDEPRVDLRLSVVDQPQSEDSKPVTLPLKPALIKKPKPAQEPTDSELKNGNGTTNGTDSASGIKRKRGIEEVNLEDEQVRKKGKVPEQDANTDGSDDVVPIADSNGGAIVIDD